jgi:hypothetical protein
MESPPESLRVPAPDMEMLTMLCNGIAGLEVYRRAAEILDWSSKGLGGGDRLSRLAGKRSNGTTL